MDRKTSFTFLLDLNANIEFSLIFAENVLESLKWYVRSSGGT